jgi:hypothetical protein
MKNFGKGMWRRVGDYDKHYGNRNAELQYYLALLEHNRMKEIYNMNRIFDLPKEEVMVEEVIKEEVIPVVEEVIKEEVIPVVEEVIKEEVIVKPVKKGKKKSKK